ncbi:hypothetical protein K440DRAFT_633516 [Wilcoxina mikolae CBS 423.85]|nr:hypothetical protein K440DRAFT_633516 [Wilcoxina mikolae CBS 423.85]
MGNLCGKESSSFDTPGRVLGSAPNPPSSSAQIPATGKPSQKPKTSGKGTTLGSPSAAGKGSAATDARAAAARAAEARNAKQANGKLGSQLSDQKRKTQNQHLQDLSTTNQQQPQLVWD